MNTYYAFSELVITAPQGLDFLVFGGIGDIPLYYSKLGAPEFTLDKKVLAEVDTSRTWGGAGSASDPNGALTLFEAIEKQFGLKLEMKKRPVSVLVIDHVEQKPIDN